MKIQYASDLHLEFAENNQYIQEHPLKPAGDILILAGDMGLLGQSSYKRNTFWDWAADNFPKTYIVPGNHEFYGGYDLAKMEDGLVMQIRPNVELHYNSVIPLNKNTDLILTILWAWISKTHAFKIEERLNDFVFIKYGRRKLTAETFNQLHGKYLSFLAKTIKAPNLACEILLKGLEDEQVVPLDKHVVEDVAVAMPHFGMIALLGALKQYARLQPRQLFFLLYRN